MSKYKSEIRIRHEHYKIILREICKDPSVEHGLCYYIRNKFGYYVWDLELQFPELYSLKPYGKISGELWFPSTSKGWEKRIKLIERCIEMTRSN